MATLPDQRVEMLRRSELFAELDEDALRRVAAGLTELDAPAGQVLINPNDPATGMYIIGEGTVVAETHDGREHPLGQGECVGELSLLADTRRTGRVLAKTPVRCLALERHVLDGLLDSEPAIARALLRIVARRLIEAQGSR